MTWAESVYAQKFLALANIRKCPKCSNIKFNEGIVIPTGEVYPNNVVMSAEWAFHMSDTHGVPIEIQTQIVGELVGMNAV